MRPHKKVKTSHIDPGARASTRRTTRASSKAATQTTIPTKLSVGQPPAASQAVRMRKGCLRELPNFAVELQLLIFQHLHPQDLFSLSRTCKKFHGFFLHPNNKRLWETALKNADDLPEKPPWMSIPAFVHLLYATYCHNCGCPNIRKVVWVWFARFCSNCLLKVSCSAVDIRRKFAEVHLLRYYAGRDYARILLNIEEPSNSTGGRRYNYNARNYRNQQGEDRLFLKRHVDELKDQWLAVPEPRDEKVFRAFSTQCRKVIETQAMYARQCKEWHDELEQERKEDLHNGRTERFSMIVEKLKKTEWRKELDFIGNAGLEKMSRLPVVRQSGKLTDKGWEKVQEAVHKFLSEAREKRLGEERKGIIRKRFGLLEEAVVAHCITIPRTATMGCRPLAFDLTPMKKLEPVLNAPSAKNITRDAFAKIVPELVATWHAEGREFLESLLRRFIERVPSGVDIFDLAVAVFYRRISSVYRMRYPYLLGDNSLRCFGSYTQDRVINNYAASGPSGSSRVHSDLKSIDPKHVEVGIKWMRNIVTKLGLDATTATLDDLEKCEARLRCLTCAANGGDDIVFGWEAAFKHTAKYDTTRSSDRYPRSSHNRWSRVNKKDMVEVKELEAVAHALTPSSRPDCCWSCALCVSWEGWKGDVRKHLATKHGIKDVNGAVNNGTIYWSPLLSDRLRRPPVTLSRDAPVVE